MAAGHVADIALPEPGQIYSRRSAQRSEWWRVAELRRGPDGIDVVLTRIDNARAQLVIGAAQLARGGAFERVEARFRGGDTH